VFTARYGLYLCVLCGSENKQRLFPYTALTDWFFITERKCVYCAVRTVFMCFVWIFSVQELPLTLEMGTYRLYRNVGE
jgi:hypothetical protein